MLEDRRPWYRAAKKAEDRWGTPVSVQLAIIRQESSFVAKAKPPRRRFLWIFPGSRLSSAYGYPQALDGTWKDYKREVGGWGADRDDFADATDFVAWHAARSARRGGFHPSDAYRVYLAYHEGDGGYRRGSYRNKPGLLRTARRVETFAARYRQQLAECGPKLGRRRFLWLF